MKTTVNIEGHEVEVDTKWLTDYSHTEYVELVMRAMESIHSPRELGFLISTLDASTVSEMINRACEIFRITLCPPSYTAGICVDVLERAVVRQHTDEKVN